MIMKWHVTSDKATHTISVKFCAFLKKVCILTENGGFSFLTASVMFTSFKPEVSIFGDTHMRFSLCSINCYGLWKVV